MFGIVRYQTIAYDVMKAAAAATLPNFAVTYIVEWIPFHTTTITLNARVGLVLASAYLRAFCFTLSHRREV